MGEQREPKSIEAAEATGALDPVTGLGRGAAALVIGKSAGERESVARAVHRAYRGEDGAFLRVQCAQEEPVLQEALQSWLAGPSRGDAPRLLTRLEHGSLFLDDVGALALETQSLLLEFLARIDEDREAEASGASPVSQPWKGQLISGSEHSLQVAVRDSGFDPNLAFRLERVRIVLDPEQAGPGR